MKNKIVFCFYTNDHEVNLGIAFISALLKRNDIESELVIYREIKGKQMDTPEIIASRILEKNPQIIAFSAMTFNWGHIRKVISALRDNFNGLILVGGYHAIISPDEIMAEPGVDGVCSGEGEIPLLKIARAYNGKNPVNYDEIEGIIFRNDKCPAESHKTPWVIGNLEDFPYLDYEIFIHENNLDLRHKHLGALSPAGIFSLPVIIGRGCPYKCTYCCNSVVMERFGGVKKFIRRYSVDNAISNIRKLASNYRPQFIEFFDETFTRSRGWTKEFCKRYRDEIGIPYSIMNRIDNLDEETVSIMAESGLKVVFFGLESGYEEFRKKFLNRQMNNDTIVSGAGLLKKHGINILTFNMFGMPYETKESVEKTIELNKIIQPDAAFGFIYQPLPGTKLGNIAYENNMTLPHPEVEMWDFHSPALDTPELPATYVKEKLEEFRSKFSNTRVVNDLYGRLREIASDHSPQ